MALAETTYCIPQTLVNHRVNNAASTSNTRSKSWDCAISAMEAIGQRLRQEGIYGLFERSYVNWLVHFTKWNAQTLDDESAAGLVGAARGLLADLPEEPGYYFLREEYEFAQLFSMSADELVVRDLRLAEECRRAKKIYRSRDYKLGTKLLRPARAVARWLRRLLGRA